MFKSGFFKFFGIFGDKKKYMYSCYFIIIDNYHSSTFLTGVNTPYTV